MIYIPEVNSYFSMDPQVSLCPYSSQKEGGRGRSRTSLPFKVMSGKYSHFCLHFLGQDLGTWPHLDAKESGKSNIFSLWESLFKLQPENIILFSHIKSFHGLLVNYELISSASVWCLNPS